MRDAHGSASAGSRGWIWEPVSAYFDVDSSAWSFGLEADAESRISTYVEDRWC